MDAPIVLEDLTFTYGAHRGVSGLTLAVEPGEIFGFLGPNGAGKTTTIRLLMGLLRPARGAARVFGLDCWRESPRVKARIGFLPGDIRLYERMTGEEFLDFFAAFRRRYGEGQRRHHALAARLDLDLGERIKHLSKGNRQKLALVQALMHDAPLLVLDEPSSGLDPLLQAELLALLRAERARGKTIFLSSHQLPEVERIAGRVGIVRDGRLVAVETVERLKARRERRMDVLLREPAPLDALTALAGVRLLAVSPDGREVALAVHGDLAPLLGILSALPLADLTFGPPDLESVFLPYYTGADGRPAAPAVEVSR